MPVPCVHVSLPNRPAACEDVVHVYPLSLAQRSRHGMIDASARIAEIFLCRDGLEAVLCLSNERRQRGRWNNCGVHNLLGRHDGMTKLTLPLAEQAHDR